MIKGLLDKEGDDSGGGGRMRRRDWGKGEGTGGVRKGGRRYIQGVKNKGKREMGEGEWRGKGVDGEWERKRGGGKGGEEEWVGRKKKEGITFFQREETSNG